MDSSFKNVSALWLEDNKLFWKESTYTKYLFISKNIFNKCLSDCKIDKINFHALRHSFATRCIELGMDYKTLSEILGHANVSTTMELYVHSSLEQKKKQINKLNNFIKS